MTDKPSRPMMNVVRAAAPLLAAVVALASCQPATPPPPSRTVPEPVERLRLPRAASVTSEPDIRVRLASDTDALTFRAEAGVIVGPTDTTGARTAGARRFASPVRLTRAGGEWTLETGGGDYQWAVPWLRVEARAGEPIAFDGTRYPGGVVLVPLSDNRGETGTFDAINHVPIEAYLPGVVEREMWPSWDDAALEAQAIAARSYALFERTLNRDRHYDMTATTASQVYGGEAGTPRVIAAVRRTRGRVVTHNAHVLPTFYSSTCGGTSQDAAAAFTHLGGGIDLPPLRSAARRAWCEPSDHYRWPTIRRDALTLSRRLRAWGEANDHAVAGLTWLARVEVLDRTPAGRPTAFTVTDNRGQRFTLAAEHFRFACNHAADDLPTLASEHRLRSSHVQPFLSGRTVHFTNGRGFGHGVGMCQWGAQGMASHGHDAHAILREFYPGARVERLY